MNFKHVMIVFKKEMKDSFRDKKSVITNILLPLVLIPLVYYCMNIAMSSAQKSVEEGMKIAVVSNEDTEKIKSFTNENITNGQNIEVEVQSLEEAKEALKEGEINCIIEYQEDFLQKIESGEMSDIKLYYDSLKNSSTLGMQILNSQIMNLNQILAGEKLAQINISPQILNLVALEKNDISVEESGKSSNEMLIMIIPMYLVIVIITAGVPLAIDVIAGERERNTFEPLLSTKANRVSILVGKYMAILVFSIIAIIMSFIGLIIGIALNPEMFETAQESISLSTILAQMNMPIGALVLTLLSAITLTIAFSGIQIAISTMAKTVKEAQTYLSYMTLPAMILGFSTMFMGAGDMKNYMSYIPIFNTIASLKMVLSGVIDYSFLITGVIVNIIFVVIISTFIVKLFNNERVIIK